MRAHKVLAAGAAGVALALALLAGGAAADEKELRAALDKLAETAAKKPDDLPKEGAALAQAQKIDYDSFKEVMAFLGARDKDSPGWGVSKPATPKPDSIEYKLREMVKDKPPMTQARLEKEAPALVELARRTAAVGAVGLASFPKKKAGAKEWRDYSEDMIKASLELAKAAGGDKPDLKAVKAAAVSLNSACSNCHAKFTE